MIKSGLRRNFQDGTAPHYIGDWTPFFDDEVGRQNEDEKVIIGAFRFMQKWS